MERERIVAEVNGKEYQIGRMSAMTQLHVARRLMPCMLGLTKVDATSLNVTEDGAGADQALAVVVAPIADALSKMSDDEVDYIVKACLKVCYFKHDKGWALLANSSGQIMNGELQLPDLIGLTIRVIQENLGGFFPGGLPSPDPTKEPSQA